MWCADTDENIVLVTAPLGECACATCAKMYPWKGTNLLDAGHAFGRGQSVCFEQSGCSPQCTSCNKWGGGKYELYREVIAVRHGEEEVERLARLKRETKTRQRDELIEMISEFRRRTKEAIQRMEEGDWNVSAM